jgi:hypothetical protein
MSGNNATRGCTVPCERWDESERRVSKHWGCREYKRSTTWGGFSLTDSRMSRALFQLSKDSQPRIEHEQGPPWPRIAS